MKHPYADEISRWLMDDTLVAQGCGELGWVTTDQPTAFEAIRVSIATVEGKPVFEGDTYCREGEMFTIERADYGISYIWWWNDCTLTPPKPKSVLDSDEFDVLLYGSVTNGSASERIKQFLRDHKDKI